MNSMPKFVASTTLREPEWNNSSLIEGDIVEAVAALKQQDGGPILVAGSRTLVHALMPHSLIDEFRLMVFPAQAFDSGVVVHTYRPGGSPR